MGRLLVTAICSLDGYVADAQRSFAWAEPGEEVHLAVNALEETVGLQLCGRRTYEYMTYWDTAPTEDSSAYAGFARIWQGLDKVVSSTTLGSVSDPRARIVRRLDVDEVRALVDGCERDVEIGGPTLAAEAWRAGLVDEVRLFLMPVALGGGLPALPHGVRADLDLVERTSYADGTVLLRHTVRR